MINAPWVVKMGDNSLNFALDTSLSYIICMTDKIKYTGTSL